MLCTVDTRSHVFFRMLERRTILQGILLRKVGGLNMIREWREEVGRIACHDLQYLLVEPCRDTASHVPTRSITQRIAEFAVRKQLSSTHAGLNPGIENMTAETLRR